MKRRGFLKALLAAPAAAALPKAEVVKAEVPKMDAYGAEAGGPLGYETYTASDSQNIIGIPPGIQYHYWTTCGMIAGMEFTTHRWR